MDAGVAVLLILICLIGAETLSPRFQFSVKTKFWNHLHNLGLGLFSVGIVQLVYSWVPPIPAADPWQNMGLELVACLLVLDGSSWVWHWLNHNLGFLWRSHQVHHTDLSLNATSSFRFHFMELVPANGLRLLVAFAFGFSLPVLVVFQIIYFFCNAFQHSNLKLPEMLERRIQFLFVTPRMHHLHHSTDKLDQRSNLGTIFSFWDRCFSTYKSSSADSVSYGTSPDQKLADFWVLFSLPFLNLIPQKASRKKSQN